MQSVQPNRIPLIHTCSLVQSWAPGWLHDGQFMVRPNLVFLASEDLEQPLYSEFLAHPLSPVQLADWLHQCFAESGPPAELLVEDEIVQGAVRFRYPRTKVRVVRGTPAARSGFAQLTARHSEHINYSVVRRLGEPRALQLYQAARAFLDSEPWQQIPDHYVFRFTTGNEELGLVVAGSSGGGDRGIYLFNSPEVALDGTQILVGSFGPAHTYLIHHQDLNFIDRHRLKPSWKYPMFMTLSGTMKRAHLKDFYWLLHQVPKFARDTAPIYQGRRKLELLPQTALIGESKPRWLENMLTHYPPNNGVRRR